MKSLFMTLFILTLTGSMMAQSLAQEPVKTAEPTTTIEFESTEYDYGEIEQGEKASHVYRFTNTGDVPLTITNARGSCGCTVPFFPKDPIFPGESSEIEVEFNSKGKKGKQSKRITITANTDPAQTFLTMKGTVLINEEIEEDLRIELDQEIAAKPLDPKLALNPDCVAIYPNPTSEILQLKLRDYIGKTAEVDVHNELGQPMLHKSIERISNATTQLDVSKFSPGLYTVTIRVEAMQAFTRCFVVVGDY